MQNAIKAAWAVNGDTRNQVAMNVGIDPNHLYKWANLIAPVPKLQRQKLERAFGDIKIDWDLYELEFFEAQEERRLKSQNAASGRKAAIQRPNAAESPQEAPEALKIDHSASPKNWWSGIIHDDTADAP